MAAWRQCPSRPDDGDVAKKRLWLERSLAERHRQFLQTRFRPSGIRADGKNQRLVSLQSVLLDGFLRHRAARSDRDCGKPSGIQARLEVLAIQTDMVCLAVTHLA